MHLGFINLIATTKKTKKNGEDEQSLLSTEKKRHLSVFKKFRKLFQRRKKFEYFNVKYKESAIKEDSSFSVNFTSEETEETDISSIGDSE